MLRIFVFITIILILFVGEIYSSHVSSWERYHFPNKKTNNNNKLGPNSHISPHKKMQYYHEKYLQWNVKNNKHKKNQELNQFQISNHTVKIPIHHHHHHHHHKHHKHHNHFHIYVHHHDHKNYKWINQHNKNKNHNKQKHFQISNSTLIIPIHHQHHNKNQKNKNTQIPNNVFRIPLGHHKQKHLKIQDITKHNNTSNVDEKFEENNSIDLDENDSFVTILKNIFTSPLIICLFLFFLCLVITCCYLWRKHKYLKKECEKIAIKKNQKIDDKSEEDINLSVDIEIFTPQNNIQTALDMDENIIVDSPPNSPTETTATTYDWEGKENSDNLTPNKLDTKKAKLIR